MDEKLKAKRELFVRNRNVIKKKCHYANNVLPAMSSFSFLIRNEAVNPGKLKKCVGLFHKRQGVFPMLPKSLRAAIVADMALAENPEQLLDNLVAIYLKFKQLQWIGKEYRVKTAYVFYRWIQAEDLNFSKLLQQTKEIYDMLYAEKPFVITIGDTTYAAMLALSGKDPAHVIRDVESCYALLKKNYRWLSSSVYTMSCFLAIDDRSANEKCSFVAKLYETLLHSKKKYGKEYELATIGALALIQMPAEIVANAVFETDEWLKRKVGFTKVSMKKHQRLMFSNMLVLGSYFEEAQQSKDTLIQSLDYVQTIFAISQGTAVAATKVMH